jgi:hypothetical protein
MAGYRSLLNAEQVGPGAAYNTSTTITDITPVPQVSFGPGGTAGPLRVGQVLSVEAIIVASNTATPTLLLGVYYGGVAGVALAATSAITTTTAMTNWPIKLRWKGRVRTLGTAGSIMTLAGEVWIPTALTTGAWRPIPETALATVAVDTTTLKSLTVGATWGTNSASNTLTLQEWACESLLTVA